MEDELYINVPPPTISGDLHIGHLLSYCHGDIMTRYFRDLLGTTVSNPLGFDNNGMPTENLCPKSLKYINTPEDMRSWYNEQCTITKSYGDKYEDIFNSMGFQFTRACDSWGATYDTSDGKLLYTAALALHKLLNTHRAYVNDKGVFVKTEGFKEAYFAGGRDKINFHPAEMKVKLDKWVEGIDRDWEISRSRMIGVQVTPTLLDGTYPDWRKHFDCDICLDHRPSFTEKGKVCVFDTWFISSLIQYMPSYNSPESYRHLKLVKPPKIHVRYHAHEIIRSWTYYTLLLHWSLWGDFDCIDNLMISGWCVGDDDTKLSKTEGNGMLAADAIKKYGANPIRYWAAKASPGTDTKFCENMIKQGQRLMTKIKNAKKFVDMNEGKMINLARYRRMFTLNVQYDGYMDDYDYTKALNLVEEVFFEDFCGKLIEDCKKGHEAYDVPAINRSMHTIDNIFEMFMRMFEPFFPGNYDE